MSLIGKFVLATSLGGLTSGGAFLWTQFGGAVYTAYLTGALMNCF
ncbi:hypothetical protein ACFQ14_06110 [Pseudahrensia aquimaris]|uniref:Fluoride ion transporter CrcB n=1 Tax=Pseudahrensia aquimaris TaxID=744461 RepID=A0ABW3FBZ9_9HYPH